MRRILIKRRLIGLTRKKEEEKDSEASCEDKENEDKAYEDKENEKKGLEEEDMMKIKQKMLKVMMQRKKTQTF